MSDADPISAGVLVSPALLDRFLERIGDDLAARPLDAAAEEHRTEIARRLERAGNETHYEVLAVGGGATVESVTSAFTTLARRVHPLHAERLQLPAPVLRLLFEHVTLAYLVLSDVDRRNEYDRIQRPSGAALTPRTEEELATVRREMARSSYARAQSAMKHEHYHTVIELLRDSVRWEPKPEVYALLGEAMARNPRWREGAIAQFREAVQLAPRDPAYRLRLAQLLEEAAHPKEAVVEYRQVLQRFPNHPEAMAALRRLDDAAGSAGR